MWLSPSSAAYLHLSLKKKQKRYAKKTPTVKKTLDELQEQSLMLLKVSLFHCCPTVKVFRKAVWLERTHKCLILHCLKLGSDHFRSNVPCSSTPTAWLHICLGPCGLSSRDCVHSSCHSCSVDIVDEDEIWLEESVKATLLWSTWNQNGFCLPHYVLLLLLWKSL